MKTKTIFLLFVLLTVLSTFIGCDHIHLNYRLKHSEMIEKKMALSKDQIIKVDNVNGFIKISTHNEDQVLISAEKFSSKKKYLDQIKLYFDQTADGLHIYSKRKKRRIKFKINYTITVPKDLKRLELSSTNGAIRVDGELGNLDFATTNGSIKMNGKFLEGDFSTTNGSIKIAQQAPVAGDLSARTTNGSITLSMHPESAFRISGRTTNGRISCEFPVNIRKSITSSRLSGDVGDGQYRVSLATTNGSIRIKKG